MEGEYKAGKGRSERFRGMISMVKIYMNKKEKFRCKVRKMLSSKRYIRKNGYNSQRIRKRQKQDN